MDITSNSRFSWRAANAFALWRGEIMAAAVIFLCASLTLQGVWRSHDLASKQVSILQERLSFVKKNLDGQASRFTAPRHAQTADAGQTIAGIRRAAQASGISVNRLSIKSEEVFKDKHVSALPLEFSATAPQSAFLPFIDALKNLNFLCRVVFLNVKPDPSDDANILLSLKLERLNLLAPVPQGTLKASAADFQADNRPSLGITAGGRSLFKNMAPSARRGAAIASSDADSLTIKDLTLAGIINNGQPKAIVENKKDAKTYYLVEGDTIGGFFVAAIAHQEVILEKSGSRESLTL